MSAPRPAPKCLPNVGIPYRVRPLCDDVPMVIRPASDHRVEQINQGFRLRRAVRLDGIPDFIQKRLHVPGRRLDQQLAVIFSYILSEKIEAVLDMRDLLDAAVASAALQALQPAELELALATVQELEVRDQAVLRQWHMRLERADYEAAPAERRYQEVDPSQRLVASTLERRWNDSLLAVEDLKKQYADFEQRKAHVATPEQKAKVLALTRDLPRLWHAILHIRWQGGACGDIRVDLPRPRAEAIRYPEPVIAHVRDLAGTLTDQQIVAELGRLGELSATGGNDGAGRGGAPRRPAGRRVLLGESRHDRITPTQ